MQTSPQYPLVLSNNRAALPASSATAEAIAERLRMDVARAIRRVCPRWLRDQADDLTQIATGRVLDRIRATEHLVEFSQGYLYRAVYSALVDEIRKRRRLRGSSDRSDERSGRVARARRSGIPPSKQRAARCNHAVPDEADDGATPCGDAAPAGTLDQGKRRHTRMRSPEGRQPDVSRSGGPAILSDLAGDKTMSGQRYDVADLAAALHSSGDLVEPRSDCPLTERIWDAVAVQLPTTERLAIVDHTIECAACAEAWRLAIELSGESTSGLRGLTCPPPLVQCGSFQIGVEDTARARRRRNRHRRDGRAVRDAVGEKRGSTRR